MKGRLVAALLVIAALVAAWWMLRGDDGSPEIAGPSAARASPDPAPAPTPRASRGADKDDASAAAPRAATVTGRVYIPGDPDHPSSTSPDLRKFEVVVYARPDTPPGDFVMPVPHDVVASARAAESGLFEIPLPTAQDGRTFLVTARADGGGFTATWHDVPAAGGRVEIRVEPATPVTSIEVRRSSDGAPVAGATVRVGALACDPPESGRIDFIPRQVVVTDAAGHAALGGHAGDCVVVTSAGLALAELNLRDGHNVVELEPGESLAGTVSWPDGRPVAGARIEHRLGTWRIGTSDVNGLAWTADAAGRFRIDHLRRSAFYTLDITAVGASPCETAVSAGDADAQIVLLPEDHAVRGVVLFADGRPAAGATVTIATGSHGGRPAWRSALAEQAVADEQGRFAFDGTHTGAIGAGRTEIAPGRHVLSATWGGDLGAPVHRGSVVADHRPGTRQAAIEIRLEPAQQSWSVVRVRDDRGRGAERLIVDNGGIALYAHRGDGLYARRIAGPAGTEVRIRVSGGDGMLAPTLHRTAASVANETDTPCEIQVPSLSPFRVRIDAGETPLRGVVGDRYQREDERAMVRVRLFRERSAAADVWMSEPDTTTADSVTYTIDTTTPGLWVSATLEGLAAEVRPVTDEERAAGECVVRIRPGFVVTGRIAAAGDSKRSDGRCRLFPSRPGFDTIPPVSEGADGSFRFERVPAGRWTLVRVTAELVRTTPVTFDVAGDVSLGDVAPAPVARFRGVVRLADGRPAAGAVVTFTSAAAHASNWPFMKVVCAGADGSFELPCPGGIDGTVTALKEACGAAAVAVTAEGNVTLPPLVLPPEGRAEVRVRAPRDVDPACAVRFELTSPVRAAVDAPLTADEVWTTRPDEQFDHVSVHRGLPPGRVIVIAEGRGWRLEAPVTIVAGETAVVTLGGE